MAGPAPALQKRRRNSPQFDELPAEGYQGDFPSLPATYKSRYWDPEACKHQTVTVKILASTKKWYEAWARSPMATEFTMVHWLRLQSLATMQDRFDRGDLGVAAELRQGLAAFGGSPLDLRRLGRQITGGTVAADKPKRPKRTTDRRARLSVVK